MPLKAQMVSVGLLISLLSLLLIGESLALKAIGPYALQISVDQADFLFLGVVVSTDEFDPDKARRVSHIEVRRSLHGDVADGDTLEVEWWTGREVHPDGMVSETIPRGPQLGQLQGLHLWSIRVGEKGLRCAYDPIPIGPSALPEMKQQLEWAQHERVPYHGAMADPERRRAKGIDLAAGDSLRSILAAYLAGYVDAIEGSP